VDPLGPDRSGLGCEIVVVAAGFGLGAVGSHLIQVGIRRVELRTALVLVGMRTARVLFRIFGKPPTTSSRAGFVVGPDRRRVAATFCSTEAFHNSAAIIDRQRSAQLRVFAPKDI
jgi:hypothetical protein